MEITNSVLFMNVMCTPPKPSLTFIVQFKQSDDRKMYMRNKNQHTLSTLSTLPLFLLKSRMALGFLSSLVITAACAESSSGAYFSFSLDSRTQECPHCQFPGVSPPHQCGDHICNQYLHLWYIDMPWCCHTMNCEQGLKKAFI